MFTPTGAYLRDPYETPNFLDQMIEEIPDVDPKASAMQALVLHGFTGSLDTVSRLRAPLEARRVEVKIPVLRGHGVASAHLYRVGWRDWAADARKALLELDPRDQEPVLLVGHSMGALVACQMAAEFPHRVKRLALTAPAFGFRSKLTHLVPLLKRMYQEWPSTPEYVEDSLMEHNTNFDEFPVESFESVLEYIPIVETLLDRVRCPVGIFFAKRDPAIAPWVPKKLERMLGKDRVTHFTYERSYHEMLQDVEADQVVKDVVNFLLS